MMDFIMTKSVTKVYFYTNINKNWVLINGEINSVK